MVMRIWLSHGAIGKVRTFIRSTQQGRTDALHREHRETHQIVRAEPSCLAHARLALRIVRFQQPCERQRIMTDGEIRVEFDRAPDLLDRLVDILPQKTGSPEGPISLRLAWIEQQRMAA